MTAGGGHNCWICKDSRASKSRTDARQTNPGERRIVVYRYGPHWAQSRCGHRPSLEVVARVSPSQRAILEPIRPLLPPDVE